MMPELFLHDALGGAYKPMLRVHTAGSVGGSTAIVAASLVQSGVHERVLTVAFEKQSESNAMWALTVSMPFAMAVVAGAGGYFAPLIRGYIRRSGAPEDTGIRVALKDRKNALKNPYAHLHLPDITFEQIASSPMLWDPVRYLETCPSSDGACAMVLRERAAREEGAAQAGLDPRDRDAQRADLLRGPRPGDPAREHGQREEPLQEGGHHEPARRDRRAPRSTCRSRGSSRCGWRACCSRRPTRAGR